MLWSVLLILCSTNALAEKRVYEITGKTSGTIGLYVETEETQVFQNIEKYMFGEILYLFRHPTELTEWRIGYGETINNIAIEEENYKASGGKDEPPADGWTTMKGDSARINFKV